jgi:hypothetical protein
MIYQRPDPEICDWWDWLQPNGTLVRICYVKQFADYPWDAPQYLYSWKAIEVIGGKFKPAPLEIF